MRSASQVAEGSAESTAAGSAESKEASVSAEPSVSVEPLGSAPPGSALPGTAQPPLSAADLGLDGYVSFIIHLILLAIRNRHTTSHIFPNNFANLSKMECMHFSEEYVMLFIILCVLSTENSKDRR